MDEQNGSTLSKGRDVSGQREAAWSHRPILNMRRTAAKLDISLDYNHRYNIDIELDEDGDTYLVASEG